MIIHQLMWGEPKPGHELQWHLAWKRRAFASYWIWELRWNPLMIFKRMHLWKVWFKAVNDIKIHGHHVYHYEA